MAKQLPELLNNRLMDPQNRAIIVIGTADWYEWLEEHTSFTYIYQGMWLTIRKEPSRSRGHYWKAYRRVDQRLRNIYLGRSCDLTPERLQERLDRFYNEHAYYLERAVG